MSANDHRNPLERMKANPDEPIAFIPVAPIRDEKKDERIAKRKAKRQAYDKSHPYKKIAIPTYLHEEVSSLKARFREIAEKRNSTETLVAMGLIEFSLRCIRNGTLKLEGRADPTRSKMAIELVSGEGWPGDGEEKETHARPKRRGVKPRRVGWRWSSELDSQIESLAKDHAVASGELTIFLLRYALKEMDNKSAHIKTHPLQMKQGITLETVSWPH
jgi:hypothetical protein